MKTTNYKTKNNKPTKKFSKPGFAEKRRNLKPHQKRESKLLTYTGKFSTFQDGLEALFSYSADAEEIFEKSDITTTEAGKKILEYLLKKYDGQNYASCLVRNKSCQVMTDNSIGFKYNIVKDRETNQEYFLFSIILLSEPENKALISDLGFEIQ